MSLRKYRFYEVSDAGGGYEAGLRPFHLRAIESLEITRRKHYGDDGVFSTEDMVLVENPLMQNPKPGSYPYESPRFVTVSADTSVDFAMFERDYLALCNDVRLTARRVAEAIWSLEENRWLEIQDFRVAKASAK